MAREIRAYVKSNRDSFEKVSAFITDPQFKESLAAAIDMPDGAEAKTKLTNFLPHIKLIERNVTFSPSERSKNIGNLYAMVERFGIPLFITFSPDDAHNALVLRLAVPSASDIEGSGISDDLFDTCLRDMAAESGFKYDNIYINNAYLHKLAADNPAACAEVFKLTFENVFEEFFGETADYKRRKTTPLHKRKKYYSEH